MDDAALKVGELASRTGLTVRTLHHYDEIGLLQPRSRTRSGHRVYGLDEVRRLQRITSLRQIGLSLEQIRACLDGPGFALEDVLAMQVQRLRDEMARQSRLVELLDGLRGRVAEGDPLTLDEVTASIEATVQVEAYYTPEQLEELSRRARSLGPEGMQRAQLEWADLFAALAEAHRRGVDPGDDAVLRWARKARSLVRAFTGGDPAIRASLDRMYQEGAGAKAMRARGMGVSEEVLSYYRDAMARLEERDGPET